jgi:hypothetical protein
MITLFEWMTNITGGDFVLDFIFAFLIFITITYIISAALFKTLEWFLNKPPK